MPSHDWPQTAEILNAFADEIATAKGTVSDTYDDGVRLFTRSILPRMHDVRPGDSMQPGVALKATDEAITVCPYLFRQVCTNGAIVAQSIRSRQIALVESFDAATTLEAVREAVRECCTPEAFDTALADVARAAGLEMDMGLHLLPFLRRLSGLGDARLMSLIFQRFAVEGDRSAFGLMNAVTSVARDTRDPERRWRLEELGGAIPALADSDPSCDDARAVLPEAATVA